MRVLGIIPAREGSKRVPKKNFRRFGDTTLIDLAVKQAFDAQLLDKIVVNSDSSNVQKITEKYTHRDIEFISRPSSLASDDSPAIEYMLQTLDFLSSRGEEYDLVVIIQPSSPFRKGADIDNTIKLLNENQHADSAVSVVPIPHVIHPHKIKTIDGKRLNPWLVKEGQATALHELPKLYVRNCAVYVFKKELLTKGITYGEVCLGYLMSSSTSIDINDPIEFEFAEYLYNKIRKR